jgi:hypothetical protein
MRFTLDYQTFPAGYLRSEYQRIAEEYPAQLDESGMGH